MASSQYLCVASFDRSAAGSGWRAYLETSSMRDPAEKISYLITAREQVFDAVLPVGDKFTPDELNKLVGGKAEHVCVTRDGYVMFVDEDSKTNTQLVNTRATALLRMAGPAGVVLGDVLLCHKEHV